MTTHPNQSTKAEVSDKPDAWLVTANGATLGVSIHPPGSLPVGTHSLVEFVPLYRRATDDKVLALVEAADKLADDYVSAITREYETLRVMQKGLTRQDVNMREVYLKSARRMRAALAGVKDGH